MSLDTFDHHGAQDTWTGGPDDLKKVEEIIDGYEGENPYESLLPIMQEIQEEFGWVPQEACQLMSRKMHVPDTQVYGILTFYADVRKMPPGKRVIWVCQGAACQVKGAPVLRQIVEERMGIGSGGTTPDGEFTFDALRWCLGACDLAPIGYIDGKYYPNLTPEKMRRILDEILGARSISPLQDTGSGSVGNDKAKV